MLKYFLSFFFSLYFLFNGIQKFMFHYIVNQRSYRTKLKEDNCNFDVIALGIYLIFLQTIYNTIF